MEWERQHDQSTLSCDKCGQEILSNTDFLMAWLNDRPYICHLQCCHEMSQRIESHLKTKRLAA